MYRSWVLAFSITVLLPLRWFSYLLPDLLPRHSQVSTPAGPAAMLPATCGELLLNNPTISPAGPYCVGDIVQITFTGSNLPDGDSIQVFMDDVFSYNPFLGEGTKLGSIPIDYTCSTCPRMLGILVNSCLVSGNESNNEFFMMHSGCGFNVADLFAQFNNAAGPTIGNGGLHPFVTPSAALMSLITSDANCSTTLVLAASPTVNNMIPAAAIVLVFPDNGIGGIVNYDFSYLCSLGLPIYVLQTANNFGSGVFNNNGPSTTYFTAGACSDSITYTGIPNFSDPNTVFVYEDGSYLQTGTCNILTPYLSSINYPDIPNSLSSPFTIPDDICGANVGPTNYFISGMVDWIAPACVDVLYTPPSALQISISCPAAIDTAGPFCSASPPVLLTASPSGGTWSGGPYITTGGIFDPALAILGYNQVIYTVASCVADTMNILVSGPPLITPSFIINPTSCAGDSSGEIINISFISGGTPNFVYDWDYQSTPGNDVFFGDGGGDPPGPHGLNQIPSGWYDFIVVDALGCSDTTSVFVPEGPAITAVMQVDSILCFGGTGGIQHVSSMGPPVVPTFDYDNLGMPGNQDYDLPPLQPGDDQDISGLTLGIYTLVISYGACQYLDTFVLSQPPLLVASATGQTLPCNNGTGMIDLTVSGGTPSYTYLWTNGSILQDPTGLSAGTYTVTVTDANGCTATAAASITINDNIPPSITCPAPLNLSCNATIPAADPSSVTASDACGIQSVIFVSDQANTLSCTETTIRTYRAIDVNGNSATCTQAIIRTVDNTPPTVPNLPPLSFQCIGDVTASNINDVVGETDNCTGPLTVAFVSDVPGGGSCPVVITRTYSITDACNNQTLVTQTITVNDNTAPTAPNLPPLSFQCIGDVPASNINDVVGEADNCTGPLSVAFVSDVPGGGSCPVVITRTYSITDACNNQTLVTQAITINDNIPPTAPNLAPLSFQCIGDIPASNINDVVGETDNCTGPLTVAFVSDVPGGGSCPVVITRTYSITDACNNQTLVTQAITVNDNIPPTAPNLAPLSFQCIGDVPASNINDVVGETDNCTGPLTVAFVSDVPGGGSCPQVITRTYSITDACNNQTLVTQAITVNDNTAPTAPNLPPLSFQCIGDVPASNINDVVGETDNCTGPLSVAFVSDVPGGGSCPQVITRTYSITDACNNQTLVTQAITVNDNTAPTAPNLPPLSFQCIGDVPASNINDVVGEADNCTGPLTVAFVSDVPGGGSCPVVITRTYSITDACNNQTLVTQAITVNDNTAPTAPNLAPLSFQCIGDVPASNINDVVGEADNCTGPLTVAFVSDVPGGGSCPMVITRTYSITDACNNQTLVTQAITVNDNTPPTAPNLPPLSFQCIGDVPASNINDVVGETDNCTGPLTVAFVSDVPGGGSCPQVITRTYSITDACNNQTLVTQAITVNDNTAPTAPNLPPLSLQCIGDVPAANINDVVGETDNCTGPLTVAFVSDVPGGGSCPQVITRTYSITDACNNQTLVTQAITVNDNTPPTAPNLPPLSLQCIGDVPAANINDVVGEADNCTGPLTVAFVSDVPGGGSCPMVITRTYSITDACNNQTLVTQAITVNDNTPPTAPNLPPLSFQCMGDIPASNINDVIGEADNCTGPLTVAFVSDVPGGGSCPMVITRTYSITDACNNQTLVTQAITVNDNTAPTAPNLPPLSFQCIGDIPASNINDVVGEADNCTGPLSVAFVSDVPGGGSCPMVITRTYSITDACNNQTLVTQAITVNDNIPPTAPNLAPLSFQCIGDVPASNINDVVGEADNCTGPLTVAFVSDVPGGGSCPMVITRTYSITDACNNQTLVTQAITVNDNTPPTAPNLPPLSFQCIGDVPASNINDVVGEADNCTGPLTVAFVSDVPGGGSCPVVITRTYSITDACNNQTLVTQAITVNDNTAPTAPNLPPLSFQCIGDVPASNINDVVGEADNCTGALTVAFVSDVPGGGSCPMVITRTYSITDACNNQTLVTQAITVNDNIPPTAPNLPPLSFQCMGDIPASNINDVVGEADNCTGALTVAFVSDVPGGGSCPMVITRTYSITDACNNQTLVTQAITVNDNTAPTAPNLPPLSFQCIGDVPASNINDVVGEADNCTGPLTVAFVSDVPGGGSCPVVITRTYSITDACNNQTLVTQAITVNDNTAPTAPNLPPLSFQCIGDVPASNINDVVGEADNCTGPLTVAFVSDVPGGGSCPVVITRTYSITDACNNQTLVTQAITVNDNTAPTAPNLPPLSFQCIGDVPASNINDVIGETDNCTGPLSVAFVSDVPGGGSCPQVITRTYSITDACNNQTLVTQAITVNDNIPPTAPNLAPLSFECIGDVPASNINDVVGEADNCTGPLSVAFVSDVPGGGSCPMVITRTYSITDACNNQTLVTQAITVNDNTAPTAPNLPPLSFQCIGDIPASNINDVVGEADNCTGPLTVAFVSDVPGGGSCPMVITRTYSITDACNNQTLVTQAITVNDNTPPTAPNLAPLSFQCIGDIPASNVNDVVGETDNCTGPLTVAFVSDVPGGGSCPQVITRTYSITDACNNQTLVTQAITVNDNTAPTAPNLPPLSFQCIGDIPASNINDVVGEADNCTGPLTVAFVSDVPGGGSCPMVITRTYSITDACNNQTLVTQAITVNDNTAPTAPNLPPLSFQCIGDIPASNINDVVGETDNCTGPLTVAFVSDVPGGGSCPMVITRTYSITDACNNQTLVTQAITVNDNTAPTAPNLAPLSFQCIGDIPASNINDVVGETDNCTGPLMVAFVSDVPGGGSCPMVITRTYSITDACNNQTLVTQAITVNDNTAPTAPNLAPLSFQCIGDIPASNINDVVGETDNCTGPLTVAFVSDVPGGGSCPQVITRTYSITDACNNQTLVTQAITVNDNTAPTAPNLPPLSFQCIGDVPASNINDVVGEADNCTGPLTVAFVSDVPGGGSCPVVITRTYSITDACNNQTLVTQAITVNDNTAPTAPNLAPLSFQCIGDIPASNINDVVGETDNCTGPLTVAFVSDVPGGGSCPQVITRTYSITDACNNQTLVTQAITVNDNTAPTAPNLPPLSFQCIGDVPASNINDVVGEADNCTGPLTVAFVSDVPGGGSCPVVITRTYSITDACNNQTLVTQAITVNDNTPPTAPNLAPLSFQCIGDVPASNINDVVGETDNCTGPLTVAFVSDVPGGGSCPMVITRTYSITDACNNQTLVTQAITVNDNTPPTAPNLAPLSFQCIGDVPASNINDVVGETDNCTGPLTVAFVSDVPGGGSCPMVITRTYSITDACNNQTLVTQAITVNDNTPPTAPNLPPLSFQCIGDVPASNINDVVGETDNCTGPLSVAFVSDVPGGGSCPMVITRTYSITDACNNQTLVTQAITVNDNTAPTAPNLPPLSFQCIGDIPASNVNDVVGETDNCTGPLSVAFVSDVPGGGSCPMVITRTYSITDACNNQTLVTQAITVNDNTAPTAPNLPPLSFQCIGDVPASNINDVIGEADNCTGPLTVAFVSDVPGGGSCPMVITRTYSITDACNNQTLVTQAITVNDNTPPTAPNLAPLSFQCIGDVPASNINDVVGEADNCTGPLTVAFVSDVPGGGSCPQVITRTYSITDACNNQTLVTQAITVNDNTPPTAPNLPPLSFQCIGDVPASNINDVVGEADNCTGPLTVAFVSDVPGGGSCPMVITRTYSITDACNNQTLVTQAITVNDNTAPTAPNLPPLSFQCIGDVPASNINDVIGEADNCTGALTVAFVSDVPGGGSCPMVITRTYSITDACNNQTLVTQAITVNDNIPPTAPNLPPLSFQCIGDVPASNINDVVGESDNCTGPLTIAFVSDVPGGGSCPQVITRTYSITDACNNQTLVTQAITVNDNTPPTAPNLPPLSFQCIGDVPASNINDVVGETDNCTGPLTVAFVSDVPGGGSCPMVITRTYSITDACNNQTLVTQAITVNDNTAPTAPNLPPLSFQCIGDIPASNINDVVGEADNCTGPLTVAFVSDVPGGGSCPQVITRTYSITDACNNQTLVTQAITVNDNTAPTAPNLPPLSFQCIGDVPASNINDVVGETDNCTGPLTVAFVSDVPGGGSCPQVITRTYSITDACSNQTLVTQAITVNDNTAPTAPNLPPLSFQCIGDVPASNINDVVGETDNCTGPLTVAFVSDVPGGGPCPVVITRTYSITDACNNQTLVTQAITVNDNIPPTAPNLAPLSFQCIGDVPASNINDVVGETDNCTGPLTVAFVSDVPGGGSCPQVITRTYSITDACNNQTLVTQAITVNDNIPPTAPNLAPLSFQCIGDVPASNINDVVGEADNCTGPLTVAFVSDLPGGGSCPMVITRTYSITDACNNQTLVTQAITVNDNTAPTAPNLPPLSFQCIGDVPASNINDVVGEADNCTGPLSVAFVSDVPGGGSCPMVITRTYSITDACNNQTLVTQAITVNDNTAPTAPNLPPLSFQCIGDIPASNINDVVGETDNCTGPLTVAFVSDVPGGGSCPMVITRTYSITDACNNQTLVTQAITVNDNTPPTAPNLAPLSFECIGDVPASNINDVVGEADNCTGALTVAFVSDVPGGGSCPQVITRTYSITDACNNQTLVTQAITVNDNTPPTAPNLPPLSFQCIGDVPASNINDVVGETDNCTGPLTVAFVSDVPGGGSCPMVITRTYSITDACNNQTLVTQAITVNDNTAPTAPNLPPLSFQCIGDVPASNINDVVGEADNCTGPLTVAFVSDVPGGGSCPMVITRTYSITDACNNQTLVTQAITVNDNTAPTAPNLPPLSFQCIGDIPASNINDVVGEADNCTGPLTVAFVSDVPGGGSCPQVITRTYSITDACNNQTLVTQAITVNDNTAPTAPNLAPLSFQCIGDIPASNINDVVGEADNCTGPLSVAFVSDVPGGGSCPEVITRTYSVTDACGNQILVTQLINVGDDIPPTASNPLLINVAGCNMPVPTPDASVVTDEADNCTAAPVVAFVDDASSLVGCTETTTRNYSVTDDCGNSIIVTQTITRIVDTEPPVLISPANLTVDCLPDVPPIIPLTYTDNCSGGGTITGTQTGPSGSPLTIVYTWTITDNCGNTTTESQTITILEILIPLSISADFCEGGSIDVYGVTYNTPGVYQDTVPSQTGGCDTLATITITELLVSQTDLTDEFCQGDIYILPDGSTTTIGGTFGPYTFIGSNGCDSIVNLNLNGLNPVTNNLTDDFCTGNLYTLPDGSTTTVGGSFGPYTFTGSNGCDSIVNLNLNGLNPVTNNLTDDFCTGNLYTLPDGSTTTTGGTFGPYTFIGSNGCDSIVNLTLNGSNPVMNNITDDFCTGDTYTLPDGSTTTVGGTFGPYTFIGSNGCDSIVNLTLNGSNPVMNNITDDFCTGNLYTLPDGSTTTIGGSFGPYTFTGSNGCDSIVNLNLNGLNPVTNNLTDDFCTGNLYTLPDGSTTTVGGTFGPFTFSGSNGCDSIVNLTLNGIDPVTTDLIDDFCTGDTYTLPDGSTTTAGGSFGPYTFIAGNGCDSIVNLILNGIDPVINNIVDDFCSGDVYTLPDGSTTTTGGSYGPFTFVSSLSCDSIVNLTLNANNPVTNDITDSFCTGNDYTLPDGSTTTTGGSYGPYTFLGSNGCDSIVNLVLNEINSITNNLTDDFCIGDTYILPDGSTTTVSGSYGPYTFNSSNGCDSIVNLALNGIDPVTTDLTDEFCDGTTYLLPDGSTTSVGGTFGPYTFLGSNGCDSIVNLSLTLLQASFGSETYQGCLGDGYSVTVNGTIYDQGNQSGTETFPGSGGCDSTVTIDLHFAAPGFGFEIYNGCTGDLYEVTVNGTIYNEGQPSGIEMFTGPNGCDTTVTINLVFNNNLTGEETYTGCEGDGYFVIVNGTIYDELNPTGTETITGSGCDSIVTIDLVFATLEIVDIQPEGPLCTSSGITTLIATPTGGIWSGAVSSDQLDPAALGVGTHEIIYTVNPGACASADTIQVSIYQLSFSCQNNMDESSPGAFDGEGQVTVTGGAPDYTIDWAGPVSGSTILGSDGDFVITSLTLGIYTVTVEDATGCTASCQFIINSIMPCEVVIDDVTIQDASCPGINNGAISITASGGFVPYEYSIDCINYQSSNIFADLAPGNYTICVRDNTGCFVSQDIQVGVGPGPELDTVEIIDASCGVTNGSISVDASGGTEPYTYSINGIDYELTGIFPGLGAGDYLVYLIDDAGCTDTLPLTIVAANAPVIDDIIIIDASCGQPDGSIEIFASGGQGTLMYSINGGVSFQFSNVFNGYPSGTYAIVVRDETLCEITGTASIQDEGGPAIDTVIIVPTSCGENDGSITIIATGNTALTYSINCLTYGPLNVFSNLAAGNYTICVKDLNGCITSQPVVVNTTNGPQIISIIATDTECGEDIGTITINATGGTGDLEYFYNGMSNGNDNTIEDLPAGVYDIEVVDENDCSASGQVTIDPSEGPDFDVYITPAHCGRADGIVELDGFDGMPPYTYSFNGGPFTSTSVFPGHFSDFYPVAIKDSKGCIYEEEVFLWEVPGPQIQQVIVTNPACGLNTGSIEVIATGASDLEYSINLPFYQVENIFPTVTPNTYTVTVKDEDGCTATATAVITAMPEPIINNVDVDSSQCGSNTGSITVHATGGTAPLLYALGNGPFGPSNVFTPLPAGTYTVKVKGSNQCEVSEDVVIGSSGAQLSAVSSTICAGRIFNIAGHTYTTAGLYSILLPNGASNGCDSIIELTLAVTASEQLTLQRTICEGDVFTINGIDYTVPGDFLIDTIHAVVGCDTIRRLNLVINQLETTSLNATICAGEVYTINGVDYSVAGQYLIDTVDAAVGCDSIRTLNLSIDLLETTYLDVSICTGEVYTIGGIDYSIAGEYLIDTVSAIVGCDSIRTLRLSIDDYIPFVINEAICEGEIYTLNGVDYAAVGLYVIDTIIVAGSCDTIRSLNLAVNPLPQADAGIDQVLDCDVLSVTLNGAASGGSPLWTGPGINAGNENQLTPSVTLPGQYILTISSPQGCEKTDTVVISLDPATVIANAGSDDSLSCDVQSITLQAGPLGTDLIYQWTGPGINASNEHLINPVITIPGTYTLVVTDTITDCVSQPDEVIISDITVVIVAIIQDPMTLTCFSTIVDLNTMGSSSGPNIQYIWFNEAGEIVSTSPFLEVSSGGMFMFVVKDTISGCFDNDSVFVKDLQEYPPADAGEPQQLDCNHETVILNEGATSNLDNIVFDWTGPPGGIIGPSDLISIVAGTAGQYVLTVADTVSGCSNSDTVMVTDMSQLPVVEILLVEQFTCIDNTAMINIGSSDTGPDIHYEWNGPQTNGVTTTTLETTEPGEYYLTVINQLTGCESRDSILLELPELPVDIEVDVTIPLCQGDASGSLLVNEVIGGTPVYEYSLNGEPLQTSPIFEDLVAGSYLLEVTDANGCTYEETFIVPDGEKLTINIGSDIEIDLGDSAQLSAIINLPWSQIDSIVWSQGDHLSCTHCIDPTLYGLINEIISASVYAGSCSDTDMISIRVDVDADVYIPNIFSPNDDSQNDVITVWADHRVKRVVHLEIFDRWGNQVFVATDFPPNEPAFGWDGTFRDQPMNPAVFAYIAKVELINGVQLPFKGDITLLR